MLLEILIPLLIGGGVTWVLRKLKQKRREHEEDLQKEARRQQNQLEDSPKHKAEKQKSLENALSERTKPIKEILNGDKSVAETLLKMAGIDNSPTEVASDPRQLLEIANKFDAEFIEMMRLASTMADLEFNLDKQTERVPVNYPTRDVEPEQITDYAQLTEVSVDQFLLEDDEFSRRLAGMDFLRPQFFEFETTKKLGYILLDYSPSMVMTTMSNGYTRAVWARAIAVKLLMMAVRGEATFLLRFFDSSTTELLRVNTSEEATALIKVLTEQSSNGSGTAIGNAIHQATKDIKKLKDEIKQSHIQLITDGEDNGLTEEKLMKMLGNTISLHTVILLGKPQYGEQQAENPALKGLSASYQVLV